MFAKTSHIPLWILAGFTIAAVWTARAAIQSGTPDEPELRAEGELSRRIAAAPAGSTLLVGPGVYREHIVVDKPLVLEGSPGAILDGGGSGDIVEITAEGVTLRGFTIRNTGIDLDHENAAVRVTAAEATIENNVLEDILFGIDLRDAARSVVRGNRIGGKALDIARRGDGLRLWRSGETLIEGNTLRDGRDTILWYSSGITVRGNVAEDCRYGLHLMFSDRVTIEENRFRGNSVGIYLMYSHTITIRRNALDRNRGPSGYGLGLKEADKFSVTDNVLTGNRVGVYIDGSPFTAAQPGVFTRNTLAYNDIGVTFLPSAKNNELYENNFIDNLDQVSVAGRGSLDANRFWKAERGNYWTDYTGYDQNGDGVGDFVHESQTLFENMMDREPKLRLFLFSPAQQAIEFVGRALPAVRPEAKFTDEVPLMNAVAIPTIGEPARGGGAGTGLLGTLMVGAGGMLIARALGNFGTSREIQG